MRTNIYLTFLSLVVLLLSCTNDMDIVKKDNPKNPFTIDLQSIEGSNAVTEIESYLENLDGSRIQTASQLSLGKTYYLVIKSNDPVFHRIGLKDGFEIIENLNHPELPSTSGRYLIKPVEAIANGIALSIIAIHGTEGKFFRERPKRLILPQ